MDSSPPQATRPVAVLGAGAFGTALATQLARQGRSALLWGRDTALMASINTTHENPRYLPGCALPDTLLACADLAAAVQQAGDVLIATPSATLRQLCTDIAPLLRADQGVACAAKGLEPGTGLFAHEVMAEALAAPHALAVVSGPTFARELAQGLPTAVTVASPDPAFSKRLAAALHGGHFRAYMSTDIVGVEIGGAAKNVLAIAVGTADGLGLGANTRAAMITRGLTEIARLAGALGARPETIMGLSGLGDLVLTCTDDQSRNRRLGLLLGSGKSLAEAMQILGAVVEGVRAAPEVLRLAHRAGIEMPLTEHVVAVLSGQMTPLEALGRLVERPLRAETG